MENMLKLSVQSLVKQEDLVDMVVMTKDMAAVEVDEAEDVEVVEVVDAGMITTLQPLTEDTWVAWGK